MWVWAVADYIAQAPKLIHFSPALDINQHLGKSRQISMNVSNDCVTHLQRL
jgi:hypothetical protein